MVVQNAVADVVLRTNAITVVDIGCLVYGVGERYKLDDVQGRRLQGWIEKRRQEESGPRGLLFKQRPTLGS